MLKQFLKCSLFIISFDALAAKELDLYQAPLSSLKQFPLQQNTKKTPQAMGSSSTNKNILQEVSQSNEDSKIIMRYQQMYRGLPVVGAQIMITKDANQNTLTQDNAQVNGHLVEGIDLNIEPALTRQQALDVAKKSWLHFNPQAPVTDEQAQLQIRAEKNNELKLVYLVSFKSNEPNNKPSWPFFVVDAQSGEIMKQWNNIKNFSDSGPGGNEKVNEYWYGEDGLPALNVTQKGSTCVMDTSNVKVVNLKSAWDWEDKLATAIQYPCNNNQEDRTNGAYSPANDAYYLGHTIVSMYKEWYGVNALQNSNGTPKKLVMRVHFGVRYDNAFWDGQYMSFGDGNGDDFYPLVSLDIAGHEVTHGFTEQHSDLEYHDQPGALNESLSDMAGQASRAYLLEKSPQLYNKMYLKPNVVTWGIGETVVRDSYGKAMRFMDFPSSDGSSADCLDKALAQSNGAYCAITYADMVDYANANISDPEDRESFVVHSGSGVFNKAFYLLAKKIGIKKAYQIMIIANSKYWTPTTNFVKGACGVLYGTRDVGVDLKMVKNIFDQVGINTKSCAI